MPFIHHLLDFVLHLDKHLSQIIQDFGFWTYLILFLIVFAETGFVVTPFLPGDSLLFAVGALAAIGALNIVAAMVVLASAAIIGNTVNYIIGKFIGPRVFHEENSRFLNRKYLERTHEFFEKYGGKTIVLTRFVPIIRTFAPFVAGVGRMSFAHFTAYNVAGGLLWVLLLVLGGYFFGNIPIVKNNFSVVTLIIIFVSILPILLEVFKHKRQKS